MKCKECTNKQRLCQLCATCNLFAKVKPCPICSKNIAVHKICERCNKGVINELNKRDS